MARNERSRPHHKGDPANTNHQRPFTLQDPPVETLLERLDRVRKSPQGWTARCPGPNHRRGDKSPSLSIAEGDDGRALLFCFAACRTEEIVAALGLELKDLFPRRDDRHPHPRRDRRRPPMKPAVLSRSTAASLMETGEFCLMFEAAKFLAPLPPSLIKQDALSAWDGLVSLGIDIPALLRLAWLIRGIAFFRDCDARHIGDADIARAVNRLINEIEGRAA